MSDAMVPITAEWALWGKQPDGTGYNLLESSDGTIAPAAFTEIIVQHFPAPLDDLPQVTVSGFTHGTTRYVGIAVHDHSASAPPDAAGRPVVFTSCYCVPFSQLTAGAVSYQAMYERFLGFPLPITSRSPIRTELRGAEPASPPANQLALRVAALLLIDKRVCVSGASDVPLDERLRFLDDVASLLPYRMRGKLSAATWVDSFHLADRLRLFFSDRSSEPGVVQVDWRKDDNARIGDSVADRYVAWLRDDVVGSIAELGAMTEEQEFDKPAIWRTMSEPKEWSRQRRQRAREEPADASHLWASWQSHPDHPRHYAPPPKDWVDRALRSAVHRGLLMFNPPEEMQQGRKDRIEVGIAQSCALREELVKGLRGRGSPQFEAIETASFMSVELKGDAFQITPYSAPIQIVAPLARWEFDVLPQQFGVQMLILSVCLLVAVPGLEGMPNGFRSIPVVEREIRISINFGYGARRFFAGNWQWLIATAAGFGGGIGAWVALLH